MCAPTIPKKLSEPSPLSVETTPHIRISMKENGWKDTLPYGVIHRLASTEHSKGVANACLQWCYEQIPNLRADTHRDNHILQYILKKHGFKYCGIILLANGDERLAFQKVEG